MAEWLVKLQGETGDLRDLSRLLTAPELNIVEKDDNFYLNSDAFELMIEARDVRVQADKHLDTINGAAKLQFGGFDTIKIGGIAHIDENGKLTHYLSVEGTLFSRGRLGTPTLTVTTAGGEVMPPPPTFIEVATAAANQHEAVADALRYFQLETNWINLYKVYEVIRDDVGGEDAILSVFSISKNQLNRFTSSADNPRASGDGARHASKKNDPPKHPMSLSEGEAFIRNLLDRWIRSK